MKQVTIVGRIFFLMLVLTGCSAPGKERSPWQPLFNGQNLTGWDTYLGPAFDPEKEQWSVDPPPGLNRDPDGVFSIVEEDGRQAIRISGERFGGLSTLQEFKNYHLQLQFKWGKKKWPPRQNSKMDSGLLYHAVGPHGADGGFWMRSQEFQIQEGDCGDYWGVAGAVFDIPAVRMPSGEYRYDPAGQLQAFRDNTSIGRHCIKHPDAERPSGEWNTVDLYCFGDTSVHVVNGVVTMVLYHSRQVDNGQEIPLTVGKIQLQSEGAEIFYRAVRIRPIDRISATLLPKVKP